nr:MAG TPA: hypothetical protein [Caudoviricetes sp.]
MATGDGLNINYSRKASNGALLLYSILARK